MSLSFGTAPSSAPANSSLSGGFPFGANVTKPANTFGLPTSQPSLFGTPATSTPGFGGLGGATPGFGAAAAPTFGASSTPGFGATSTPGFGATSTPGFGATATPGFGSTGLGGASLNFGAGSNTTTTSTGLGFGAPISSATTGGLNFGAPASSAPGLGGFNFGAPTAATTAPSLGFGLGSTATTTPSLFEPRMYTPFQNSQVSSMHCAPTPTTQTYQTFAQPQPLYPCHEAACNYHATPMRSTMHENCTNPTTCMHLKMARRDAYPILLPSFGTSLGATNVSLSTTSAPVNVGLGGLATTTAGIAGSADTSTTGKGSEQQPKQTKLPNEISTSVDTFKEFVKKQKSLSSDVMRVSIKPLQKVSRLAEETARAAAALTGEAGRERAHARRLRAAAARALAAAERAGRPPPGGDSEELAPPAYVLELIAELEGHLLTFRRQMDIADRQMQAPQRLLTEQELSLGMRRMHESLVALAGRLQTVHAQVQEQKERYLQLRRHLLKDTTDVFHTSGANDSLEQLMYETDSARKRSKSPGLADGSLARAVLSDPRAALGSLQRTAGPTPFTHLGNTLSSLPAADTSAGLSWTSPPAPQGVSFGSLGASGFGSLGASGFGSLGASGFGSLGASGFGSPGASSDGGAGFQLQKAPKRGKQ